MTAPSCRDCKHCSIRRPTDSRLDMCHALLGSARGFYCTTERALRVTGCGPQGVNFEAKVRPWWAFWRKK